jgi:hypothetical protein
MTWPLASGPYFMPHCNIVCQRISLLLKFCQIFSAVMSVRSSCSGLDVSNFLCVVERGLHSRVIFVSLHIKLKYTNIKFLFCVYYVPLVMADCFPCS